MAQQFWAPPQWVPSIIKETAARHNPAFAHFRGRPIHPTLPDLDLPAHDVWAVHIFVPHDTVPRTGEATARVTKQPPNTALHYDIARPNVIVTHNTGRDHYYLQATHERSPIAIYTFTTYPGLQPPQHQPRPLHVAPTLCTRPAHHAPPPAHSTALHAARRRAAAHHQNHLLPRMSAGPGTVTEATHKSTLNLLARKLRPKMALGDTYWIYYGESRTARVADLRTIIPRHIQRVVGPFTVYAVPHPKTAQCTPCNPGARYHAQVLCSNPCPPLPTGRAYTSALYPGTHTPTSCPQRTATTPYRYTLSSTWRWDHPPSRSAPPTPHQTDARQMSRRTPHLDPNAPSHSPP